jgi:hypothetical protein
LCGEDLPVQRFGFDKSSLPVQTDTLIKEGRNSRHLLLFHRLFNYATGTDGADYEACMTAACRRHRFRYDTMRMFRDVATRPWGAGSHVDFRT